MKLELKHLAPYLPYGLMIHQDGGYPIEMEVEHLRSTLFEAAGWFVGKPLLRPLSDLTKEIEHNGEKFVPIERMEELSSEYFDFLKHPLCYPYDLFIMLLEWHFDVFGLLNNELAVIKTN